MDRTTRTTRTTRKARKPIKRHVSQQAKQAKQAWIALGFGYAIAFSAMAGFIFAAIQ